MLRGTFRAECLGSLFSGGRCITATVASIFARGHRHRWSTASVRCLSSGSACRRIPAWAGMVRAPTPNFVWLTMEEARRYAAAAPPARLRCAGPAIQPECLRRASAIQRVQHQRLCLERLARGVLQMFFTADIKTPDAVTRLSASGWTITCSIHPILPMGAK